MVWPLVVMLTNNNQGMNHHMYCTYIKQNSLCIISFTFIKSYINVQTCKINKNVNLHRNLDNYEGEKNNQ